MNTKFLKMVRAVTRTGIVASMCLLLAAPSLLAQTPSYFEQNESSYSVMAGVGYARTDFKHPDQFSGVENTGTPHYRIMLGYRVLPNLGVGVGMANIGTTTFRGLQTSSGQSVSQIGEIRALSAEAYVTGHLPLTQLSSLFGRGGVGYLNISQSSVTDGSSATVHSNGVSPFVGLGAEVDFMKQVAFRIGLDWYFNAGDPAVTGQGPVSAAYAGLALRFHSN